MTNTYDSEFILKLTPNQVFVMGTNYDGFHGGGSAGFASFGAGKTWREMDYAIKPNGWKGKWNVKGMAEGYQEGMEGRSYGLPTVIKAGAKLSLKPSEIIANIKTLYNYAANHPELEFLVAYSFNGRLLNGYDNEDMVEMFWSARPIPNNVKFSKSYAEALNARI